LAAFALADEVIEIVARFAHRSPRPNPAMEGITNRANQETKTQENRPPYPAFLQKSKYLLTAN
jgi:hypothetical protein